MRLIDADLLMDNLGFDNTAEEREENVGIIITWEDVDRMTTAYDRENVLEQLEKSRGYIATTQYCNDMNGDSTCDGRNCFKCCFDYLIGIVKRGGGK